MLLCCDLIQNTLMCSVTGQNGSGQNGTDKMVQFYILCTL